MSEAGRLADGIAPDAQEVDWYRRADALIRKPNRPMRT